MTYTDIYFLSDISHICTVSAGSLKHGFILEKKRFQIQCCYHDMNLEDVCILTVFNVNCGDYATVLCVFFF